MPETQNPSGDQTQCSTQKGSGIPPLQFDPGEFRPFLKNFNMTAEQEIELLQSIWVIIRGFAEAGFKGDAVSLIFQELEIDKITEEEK